MEIGLVKLAKTLSLVLLVASQIGCAGLQPKKATIRVEITTGIVNLDATIDYEKKEEQENSFVQSALKRGKFSLMSSPEDILLEIDASNAVLRDQFTSALIQVRSSSGQLLAASTFSAKIINGVAAFSDVNEVIEWLDEFAVDTGSVTVGVSGVSVSPPSQGWYTVSSRLVMNSSVLASASASAFVEAGGTNPPRHEN